MSTCKDCNTLLVVGDNWLECRSKKLYKICNSCANKKYKKWYKKNKKKKRGFQDKWEKENREKRNSQKKVRYWKDPEKYRENSNNWAKGNPEYINYNSANRRAAKLQRTPSWADLKAIREFYKNCPTGYHVDHIIPLQGKNISGFHTLENLQYLTAEENLRKGNRYET